MFCKSTSFGIFSKQARSRRKAKPSKCPLTVATFFVSHCKFDLDCESLDFFAACHFFIFSVSKRTIHCIEVKNHFNRFTRNFQRHKKIHRAKPHSVRSLLKFNWVVNILSDTFSKGRLWLPQKFTRQKKRRS